MADSMALAELAFVPWAVKVEGATIARFESKMAALQYMSGIIREDGVGIFLIYDYVKIQTDPIKIQPQSTAVVTP